MELFTYGRSSFIFYSFIWTRLQAFYSFAVGTFPEEKRREMMVLLLMETLREGQASGPGERVGSWRLGGWVAAGRREAWWTMQ